MDKSPTLNEITALLAATLDGDRWLNSDAAALFVGAASRRAFLERIACKPNFPRPSQPPGSRKVWKRSELDEWMEQQRHFPRNRNAA